MKIFFSYGRDDYKDFVYKIKKYLEDNGFDVFLDTDYIDISDSWEQIIEKALDEREKIVFFITKHSTRHKGYCRKEIIYAFESDKEKSIYPIIIEKSRVPLSVCDLHRLDLGSHKDEDNFSDTIIEKLEELIKVLKGEKKPKESNHFSLTNSFKLTPIDFSQDTRNHKKIIGRKWILSRIEDWIINTPKSKLLLITADPGYGKSALATYISNNYEGVIGIHFCSYNYPKVKNNPLNFIKNLAYQIQSELPQVIKYTTEVILEDLNAFELFEHFILNPLNKINLDKTYFFIIDALDEARDEHGNYEVYELIRKEFHKLPDNIKIIITSRPDSRTENEFKRFNPIKLKAQEDNNIEDCKDYIEHSLERLGHLKYNNDQFVNKVLDISKANMLFLKMFFRDIETKDIDINSPNKFPISLNGIYESFISRIINSKIENYSLFLSLFEVISASKEPLSKSMIVEILNFKERELNGLLDKLTSIVVLENNNLIFFHKSFDDWLKREDNTKYGINVENGEKRIREFAYKVYNQGYKNEYLNFLEFNKLLISIASIKTNKLESYYELIENTDPIDQINILEKLSFNNFLFSIPILKKIVCINEVLLKENPEDFIDKYIESLENLVIRLNHARSYENALFFSRKQYLILKKLFNKDEKKWVIKYSENLYNLAFLLNFFNKYEDGIEFIEEACKIFSKLYNKEEKKWGYNYAVSLNKLSIQFRYLFKWDKSMHYTQKSLEICEELFNYNENIYLESENGRYFENIVRTTNKRGKESSKKIESESNISKEKIDLTKLEVNNLINMLNKHFDCVKKIENIIKLRLQNTHTLILCKIDQNKNDEAITIANESFSIISTLYNYDAFKWGKYFQIAYKLLGKCYRKNDLAEAIKYTEKSLQICKKLYNKSTFQYRKQYTSILNGLAILVRENNNLDKFIDLEREIFKVNKEVFEKYPEFGLDDYLDGMRRLVDAFNLIGRQEDAILMQLKALNIYENLGLGDQRKRYGDYLLFSSELVRYYDGINNLGKVISLKEKTVKITEDLCQENPKKCLKKITGNIINLADKYKDIGEIKKAIILSERALEINKKLYEKDCRKFSYGYLSILNYLPILYWIDKSFAKSILSIFKFSYTSLKYLLYYNFKKK